MKLINYCAAFLCLVAYPAAGQSSSAPAQRCDDAQVMAIQGGWIANPGKRSLKNWSCVNGGDEIVLANNTAAGEITIIYRRGATSPDTFKCNRCRNGYHVKAPAREPDVPISAWDKIKDFFFSIIEREQPQPVPGILQGQATPEAPPTLFPNAVPSQPALTCTVASKFDIGNIVKLERYNLRVTPLNAQAREVTWESDNIGAIVASRKHVGTFTMEQQTSSTSLTVSPPLHEPALYAIESWPLSKTPPQVSVLVLIAPDDLCNSLSSSYEDAVKFTDNWPKSVSPDAVRNFRLRFLQGLADDPEHAPIIKAD